MDQLISPKSKSQLLKQVEGIEGVLSIRSPELTEDRKINFVLCWSIKLRSPTHYLIIIIIIFPQNHTVERIWPEVNHRVNYPIKRKLIEMEENNEVDMTCLRTSSVSHLCAHMLLHTFVQAWNSHPIAGT